MTEERSCWNCEYDGECRCRTWDNEPCENYKPNYEQEDSERFDAHWKKEDARIAMENEINTTTIGEDM